MKRLCALTLSLVALALVMTSSIAQVQASTIDFIDDFNDSDYSGWTVLEGSFSVDESPEKRLVGTNFNNLIAHPSTRTNGTWLFEMYEDSTTESEVEMMFITQGTTLEEIEGYSLHVWYHNPYNSANLYRWNYSSDFDRSTKWSLEQYNPEDDYAGWFTYNITRTENGDIYVTRDGELVIDALYDEYETYWFDEPIAASDNIIFYCELGGALDNVIVGEDIDLSVITSTTSTETTDTTTTDNTTTSSSTQTQEDVPQVMIVAGVSVALMVVVIFVIVLKRR